ncbi:WhiB family transcriptional regulator [Embleya sp. NPDC059237]|uniref:WhiB family transcriptional regulator n=1 Tax=Embleya sp. NPDC059237 TaxID=3346784 RepID=UPI0036877B36
MTPPVTEASTRIPRWIAPTNTLWELDAACGSQDPDLFVDDTRTTQPPGDKALPVAHRAMQVRAALAVCASCPVVAQCRDAAIASRDNRSIRGGMTARQRRAFAKHDKHDQDRSIVVAESA